jgi:hypothetical protein
VTFTNTRGIHELIERDINAPLPGTYIPGKPQTGIRPYGNIGDIYNWETDGIINQNQILVNVNTRISSKVSLNGGYFFNHARSNIGGGLPANDYDLAAEYSRANFDVHHRAHIMGSIATKWDIRLSPFIILASGAPFDILSPLIAGNSTYTLRPAFAPVGTPGAITFQGNTFDPYPYLPDGTLKPGEKIIPRNFGNSPGSVTINMRISKTWGFGPERTTSASRQGGGDQGGDKGPGGGGDRGPRGGGGGGPRGGGGPGGGGGMRGMGGGGFGGGGGGATNRRYNLTLSLNARNLINHTNFGPINGNLSSPTFGTSTTLAGGFGAESSPLNNRRLDFQLRFAF